MFLSAYPFIHPLNPFAIPIAPYRDPDAHEPQEDWTSDRDRALESLR